MISLRNHIISIAAVFMAVAVGVVLGSTSLSERLLASVSAEGESMSEQVRTLRAERETLRAELAGADRLIRAVGPTVVQGQLDQRSVMLFSTWDVPKRELDETRELLRSAGANVTGVVHLTDGVVDPERAEQLRSIVTGLLPTGIQLPVTADPGTLAGGLLGALTLVNPEAAKTRSSEQERVAALRGMTDGGFVRLPAEVVPAELAVVLTGGGAVGERAGVKASTLARFAAQIDRSGSGAVLAGRSGSADDAGAVGVTRADAPISSFLSTVDVHEAPSGRVATVLALREQWDGQSGHYGLASSAQGEIPNPRG